MRNINDVFNFNYFLIEGIDFCNIEAIIGIYFTMADT